MNALKLSALRQLRKNVKILTDFTESISPVQGDRNRLKQVLLNLLTNAIKYNSQEGTITIRLESAGGNMSDLMLSTPEQVFLKKV